MTHAAPVLPVSLHSPVVAVVGPTASGKSGLADALAAHLGGEILSADSMQVYRGMDIGTAKMPADRRSVVYHGIDILDPGEPYSAALFQRLGRRVVSDIDERGSRCIVCGGTGLYIRALIDDFTFPAGDQVDNPTRSRYESMAEREGAAAVYERLRQVDPASAAVIHPNNLKRVIRALEMHEEGKSYAEQVSGFSTFEPYLPAVQIGLAVEADVLAERIDRRVDRMVEEGLVGEVERLADGGLADALTASQAIGYAQILDYLQGRMTLDDAIGAVKTATRRYAKRQRTWFKRDGRIRWLDAGSRDNSALLDEVLALLARIDENDVEGD